MTNILDLNKITYKEQIDSSKSYLINILGADGKEYRGLMSFDTIVAVYIGSYGWKLVGLADFSVWTSRHISNITGKSRIDMIKDGDILTLEELK